MGACKHDHDNSLGRDNTGFAMYRSVLYSSGLDWHPEWSPFSTASMDCPGIIHRVGLSHQNMWHLMAKCLNAKKFDAH
ncbi:hypothetical protein TNCV_2358321 [Trichonephila clavipes]|nr:hypothetical protein TNCV_2358321 [Trichonephila clavipes]